MDEQTLILVERAQRGDQQATGALFERYRGRVRAALRRMSAGGSLRRVLDSEDIVQDAVLAALEALERFEYRGQGSFLAWLLQTARRELLDRVRARSAQKRHGNARSLESVVEPPGLDASPSQVAQGNELEARVQECLERMPERERSVLMLRRYLDAGTNEIQIELGLPSPGAVRALLSRAQVRLAQMLEQTP